MPPFSSPFASMMSASDAPKYPRRLNSGAARCRIMSRVCSPLPNVKSPFQTDQSEKSLSEELEPVKLLPHARNEAIAHLLRVLGVPLEAALKHPVFDDGAADGH